MRRCPLVAMENTLFGDRSLDWEKRCATVAAAGFDGIYAVPYPLAEEELSRLAVLAEAPARHGLKLAAVYANLDLAHPTGSAEARRLTALFERSTGVPRIELSVKCSAPTVHRGSNQLDDDILQRLEPLLAMAERRGFDVALYPHSFYPLQSPAHAARLVARSQHPRLRYLFAASHVYAVSSEDDTLMQLRACAQEIASFNVCGCRRSSGFPSKCFHFPPDQGDLAIGPLLAALESGGYLGEIIVQGHGWTGDLTAQLRRSVASLLALSSQTFS